MSTDFAEFADFAEENFYSRVSKGLHCTKMVQLLASVAQNPS
jgi:hypothetical protein